MVKSNKEFKEMQLSITPEDLPSLPEPEEKRPIQAEVNRELFDAAHREMVRRKVKIREAIEWGFKAFLLKYSPKEALKLGIKPGKEY